VKHAGVRAAGLVVLLSACSDATAPLGQEGEAALIPSFASSHNVVATDLGSLGTGAVQVAQAVNSRGHVVGTSANNQGRMRAFYWTSQTGMTDIGTTGGLEARALDLNDDDVVVGWSRDPAGYQETFTWSPGGGLRDLGRFGGLVSAGMGINNSGTVAGYYAPTDTSVRGFRRTSGGTFTTLPTLGSNEAWAMSINGAGQVIGISSTSATAPYVGFRWTSSSGIQSLGTMGANFSEHTALRISEIGVVAGGAFNTTTGLWHPFLWHSSLGFVDLKTRGFAANRSGIAYGVNLFGHVAVLILEPDGRRTPAVWVEGTGVVTLPNLGGADGEVWDINDLGMIVGWSLTAAGQMRATRWQVVFSPTERLQNTLLVLSVLEDTASSNAARNRLDDAGDDVQDALDDLAETPPNARGAMSHLEDAAQYLESIIAHQYIDQDVAVSLAEVVVQAARDLAVAAIEAAKARGGRSSRIAAAEAHLADGDEEREGSDYNNAVDDYRYALIDAENA
jgi:probable HAF family extracellular repeat protein